MQNHPAFEPPKWAHRLLRWYCPSVLLEEIEGDLLETFYYNSKRRSAGVAQLLFVIDVIRFFNPTTFEKARRLRSKIYYHRVNHWLMFQNFLKIAVRSLFKNKYTTIINFVGLVVGMTAALLLWQYVAFERSYDKFHEKVDRIVRVRTDRFDDGVPFMQLAAGTACAGPLLKQNCPEVEDYVKIYPVGEGVYKNGDVNFREDKVAFATPSYFSIFSFELSKGDTEQALAAPFTACIAESVATKYFGDANPIGQTLVRNEKQQLEVTGVFPDPPANSHLKYDILISYITFSDVLYPDSPTETSPWWDGYLTYLLLKPGVDQKALEAKFPGIIEKNFDEEARSLVGFALQPMKDIYLTSNFLFEASPNGDGNAVRFLLIIGCLVLIIAWFNYVNLSTARAETRAKEVGMRKVVGSTRRQLIGQFLTEAFLLNILAIGTALVAAQLLMPYFQVLVGKTIPLTLFSDPVLWLGILGVLVLGTLLAGLYPAFVLSAFKPIQVLKSTTFVRGANGSAWFRKVLVIGQFAASVALIAGTIIVFKQLSYMQQTKLGLNIDQKLIIKAPTVVDSTFWTKYGTFEKELENVAAIQGITSSTTVPGQPFGWTAGGIRRWGAPETDSEGVQAMAADYNFTEVYEMELAAGRSMFEAMRTDSNACLINESAVQQLGFASAEEAINVDIDFWGERLKIVGVLKNFHQQSPRLAFEPLVLRPFYRNRPPDFFTMKLSTGQLPQTLAAIETTWEQLFPGNPFEYFFLDDHFNDQYAADRRFGQVFGLFALLAIFVSCLGLFALAAFMAERRTKEFGIRKVLGASIEHLIGLQLKSFIFLVLIGILVASPIAWWSMNRWLEDFAFRTSIPWWVFGFAGLAAILIAGLTVSVQSLKTATANPVKALRNE